MSEDLKDEQEIEEPAEPKKSGSNFYKEKLNQILEENKTLKEKLEQEKTNILTEKENFKELYDLEKQKREEAETKSKTLTSSYVNFFKTSAIKEEAIKGGILDQALDDISLVENSMVQIETTDKGNVNVYGAKEFVEQLKQNKPHWFKKIGAPNVNNANSEMPDPPKPLSARDLLDLEKNDPVAYRKEMSKLIDNKK